MTELNKVQATIANQRKEFESLKMRCDMYKCVHPDTIYDFSLIDDIDPGRRSNFFRELCQFED